MASDKSPWFWTCGIGCGVLVILAAAGIVGAGLFFRDTFSGFEQAVEARKELEAHFGDEDDFVAPPGGVIPPERIEAFLQVRRESMEKRRAIADFFDTIPNSDEVEELDNSSFWVKLTFGLSMARQGLGLGGDLGQFFEQRNRALVDQEMGLGEYIYIYCTAYYSFLEKPLEDGPGSNRDSVSVSESNLRKVRRAWVGAMERAVENEAEASGPQALLVEELEKLEQDSRRIPWQDGLPEAIAEGLAPYREELENTYIAVTNPFELGITEQNGNFSFSTR